MGCHQKWHGMSHFLIEKTSGKHLSQTCDFRIDLKLEEHEQCLKHCIKQSVIKRKQILVNIL